MIPQDEGYVFCGMYTLQTVLQNAVIPPIRSENAYMVDKYGCQI